MDILPNTFLMVNIGGIWSENNRFYFLRLIYTTTVIFCLAQFTLSLILYLATMEGSVDEFTEVLFLTFNFINLSFKISNFMFRKNEMMAIINSFRMPLCLPKSIEEEEILAKFKKLARKVFLFIFCLSESSGFVLMTRPLFTPQINETILPFKGYQFFNVENNRNYWITFVYQFFSGSYGIMLDVSLDTMMYGFMIITTAQFKLNSYRFKHSTCSIKDCIEHHVLIQNIVDKIQSFYIPVIMPALFVSLIVLCTSIFQMSQVINFSFRFTIILKIIFLIDLKIFFRNL